MSSLQILLIEDEAPLIRALEPTLAATGATVRATRTGGDGLEALGSNAFDVVLCDLGLPDIDGPDLIKEIRAQSDVPIIVLSARGMEQDRIVALDSGADDFVGKPFSAGELLARIRAAVRRRTPKRQGETLKFPGIEVDLQRRRAILDGVEIRLSAREHSLLTLLAESEGGVVTHRQIIERVWGTETKADTQFVRVLVGQLRQKLEEDPARPRILCTEPGLGYRLGTE
jgi:two-component system KDP operon response regulator KdpE